MTLAFSKTFQTQFNEYKSFRKNIEEMPVSSDVNNKERFYEILVTTKGNVACSEAQKCLYLMNQARKCVKSRAISHQCYIREELILTGSVYLLITLRHSEINRTAEGVIESGIWSLWQKSFGNRCIYQDTNKVQGYQSDERDGKSKTTKKTKDPGPES